jgi:outer membrane protein assembly factor BamB
MLFPVSADEENQNLFLAEHPDPVYNRSLSDQEIALPFDGYHRDFLGERTIKLDQPAPREKPARHWSRQLRTILHKQMIVDSKGYTWFICYTNNRGIYNSDEEYEEYLALKHRPVRALVRINPDNSISWKRDIYRALQDYFPVVVCKEAVIMFIKTYTDVPSDKETPTMISRYDRGQSYMNAKNKQPQHDVSLECIDYDGNTVWRTPSVKVGFENYFGNMVWRISDNRVMIATGKLNAGSFSIYSIKDGSLLETITFPEWNSGKNEVRLLEPIELLDKGWIGFQKDGIVLFNSSLKAVWKHKIAIKEIISRPVIIRNALVFGTGKYLAALDLDTGKIIWKREEYSNAEIQGAEPDTDIILFTISSSENHSCYFYAVDHNASLIFSRAYPKSPLARYDRFNHTIVYSDGGVLYNDKESLNLFDKSGALQWNLNLNDFGFSVETHTMEDALNIAPDGRIVICITNDDYYKKDDDYIFSLN